MVAAYTGYKLEQSANLLATDWSPVTDSVAVTGYRFTISIEIIGKRGFFRLRKL